VRRLSRTVVCRLLSEQRIALGAAVVLALGCMYAGGAEAQPPVSDPAVECEVLITETTSVSPGMQPFAVLGLNLVENNADFLEASWLYQIDVVIPTNLFDTDQFTDEFGPATTAVLDSPDVRDWVAERMPTVWLWADGVGEADEQSGTFQYRYYPPCELQPTSFDRPLRGTGDYPLCPGEDPEPEIGWVSNPAVEARNPDLPDNPPNGGDYLLPFDPTTCDNPGLCDPNVDAIFRTLRGSGLTPLIYRFTFEMPAISRDQAAGMANLLRDDADDYEGNDIYVVVRLSRQWPIAASISASIFTEISPLPPIIPTAYPRGAWTRPVDLLDPDDGSVTFEGCEPEAFAVPAVTTRVQAVQYASSTTPPIWHIVPAERDRPRPDGAANEYVGLSYGRPQVVPFDTKMAVIEIFANGGNLEGDPPVDPWFIERVTVTLTDIGGGGNFGRLEDEMFRGDGGFNPLTGLEPFSRQTRGRGVEFWRDEDNDGVFNPTADSAYRSYPTALATIPGSPSAFPRSVANLFSTFPYAYVRDPNPFNWTDLNENGVRDPGEDIPDDPEWTICLEIDYTYKFMPSPEDSYGMDADNIPDFALEEDPEDDPDEPDFFIVIRTDSGYADTSPNDLAARTVGDGTAIEYGADFRAYIRPELLTDIPLPDDFFLSYGDGTEILRNGDVIDENGIVIGRIGADGSVIGLDPLNQIAEHEAGPGYKFPGGVLLSTQAGRVGGGGPSLDVVLTRDDATVLNANVDVADMVMQYSSTSTFSSARVAAEIYGVETFAVWEHLSTWWETVPFFLSSDLPPDEGPGPRSEFYFRSDPGNQLPRPFITPFSYIMPSGLIVSDGTFRPIPGGLTRDPPFISIPRACLEVERNYFTGRYGHRRFTQRIDSTSGQRAPGTETGTLTQVPMLAINVASTPDPEVIAINQFWISQIDLFLLSVDARGRPTGFEPTDLFEMSPDGLGPTGISLWLDNPADGVQGLLESADTQIELVDLAISEVEEAVELDGIHQDYNGDGQPDYYGVDANGDGIYESGLDAVGYRVTLRPKQLIQVPQDDLDGALYSNFRYTAGGSQGGDDLFIAIETSDTISYKDRIEMVIPAGLAPAPDGELQGLRRHGIHFLPQGVSTPSASLRADPPVGKIHPLEPPPPPGTPVGTVTSYLPFDRDTLLDERRTFSITQLQANVPVELYSDVEMVGRADYDHVPIIGIDVATDPNPYPGHVSVPAEVYLEQLIVELYNEGDDNDFNVLLDLMPFTIDSRTSGIGLWRDLRPSDPDWDAAGSVQGVFDRFDRPLLFDDPPDLIGAVGEPETQVRMVFSSPGTDDNWSPPNPWSTGPEPPRYGPPDYPQEMADEPLRQRVPTTFGWFIPEPGHEPEPDPSSEDLGIEFFLTVRMSSNIDPEDDFRAGIIGWGPDTPTAPDPDTFTAPPAPWQPADEYEIFQEFPWGSRAIGFIEILPDGSDPSGFDFVRSMSHEWIVSDVLFGVPGGGGAELVITAVYPDRLAQTTPAAGSQIVVIEGSGFTVGVNVTIDGVILTVLDVTSTRIIAEVPPLSDELTDGVVTVGLGSDQVTWEVEIVPGVPPTIDSVVPGTGIAGIEVLITGTNFDVAADDGADALVFFSPTGAAEFPAVATRVSAEEIMAEVPVEPPPGPLFVRVENPSTGLVALSAPIPDGAGGYEGGFVLPGGDVGDVQVYPEVFPTTTPATFYIVIENSAGDFSVQNPNDPNITLDVQLGPIVTGEWITFRFGQAPAGTVGELLYSSSDRIVLSVPGTTQLATAGGQQLDIEIDSVGGQVVRVPINVLGGTPPEVTAVTPISAFGPDFFIYDPMLAGSGVVVTGANFSINEQVAVWFGNQLMDIYEGATTNATSIQVGYPEDGLPNGLLDVRVRNLDTGLGSVFPGVEATSTAAQLGFWFEAPGGGGGGGCFVATAAYGTPWASDIQPLREFRDRMLLSNPAGTALVRVYYRYSPAIADLIVSCPAARTAVRAALAPMVWAVRLAGVYRWFWYAAAALAAVAVLSWRRMWRVTASRTQ